MENEPQKGILGDRVIGAIKSGDVKMRPRWYFLIRDMLGIIAIVIILLIAVYIGSFIIFVLHQDGAWFVPVFGFAGWYSLFNALPWVLIALSGIFVVVLGFLVARYPFSYKWPLLYSFLGIVFLVSATSFLFVQTSFSSALFELPIPRVILGEYYPDLGVFSPNDVHRGVIISINQSEFIVQDLSGETSTVFVASATIITYNGPIKFGDAVVIFGNRSASGTIHAVGVEKIGG